MTQLMRQRFLLRASMLAMIAAVGIAGAQPARAADEVTQERLLNADKEPGNWLHHHKNFSGTRFSALKDINRDNVKNLPTFDFQLSREVVDPDFARRSCPTCISRRSLWC